MSKPDGGQAFPRSSGIPQFGMTLRDYFAAAALQGIIQDRENVEALWNSSEAKGEEVLAFTAEKMYAIADAMLAERAK